MAERTSDDSSVWYRLGYAVERARSTPSSSPLRSLAERDTPANDAEGDGSRPERSDPNGDGDGGGFDPLGTLVTLGAGSLASRIVELIPRRREPGVTGLLRAGAAGLAAALLRHGLRPFLEGGDRDDARLPAELGAGVVRGLLYAQVLEPRLFGGAVTRGVLAGAIEYVAAPWGGLHRVLGAKAPLQRIPVVSSLLDDTDLEDDTFVEHVAFAVALAVLYDLSGGSDPVDVESEG